MGKINQSIHNKFKAAFNALPLKNLKKKSTEDHLPLEDNEILNKAITPKKRVNKKEKYRQKHKNLMQKFAVIKKQQKEERARRNRKRAAIIGDLKPLKDALPPLDELFKLSKIQPNIPTGLEEFNETNKLEKKLNVKQRLKAKKDKFIRQVTSYEALLKDPDFKKNPREAIKYHIKYKYGLNDE